MPRQSGIRVWRRLLFGLLAVALLALASSGTAFAQGPVVTTTDDDGDGTCDATCTLRDAVGAANQGDTIVLGAETYSLKGQLVLAGVFTIKGASSRATTIQSDGESRVALVPEGGQVTVNDLTVSGGFASDTGGGFRVEAGGSLELNRATVRFNEAASGGGISSSGTLRIFQSTVRSNFAGFGAPGTGGGIHLQGGNAQLRNTTVTDNWAIAGDAQQPSLGGGIYTASILLMEHVTISRNLATAGGGLYQASERERDVAMWNTLIADNGEQACGGDVGLIDGDHNLADDKSCQLDPAAGDVEVEFADLLGPGDHGGPTDTDALGVDSEAIDAATSVHCLQVDQRGFARPAEKCDIGAVERRLPPVVTTREDSDDGVCAPDHCSLRDALVDSEPDDVINLEDGVYAVELGELQLRGNRVIIGKGARGTTIKATGPHRVLSVLDGTSHVQGVEISGGNVVDGKGAEGPIGGGIFVGPAGALSVFESAIQGNRAAAGGGIANQGALAVVSSTIASNEATGGGGGGLLMDYQSGSYLENATVSGNTAAGPGGGIANLGGTLNTLNITIAGNHAPTGGGIYGDVELIDGSFTAGATTLTNTIVAGDAGACTWESGHEVFPDHSLATDDSCFQSGGGNQVESNPGIGPLSQDFGSTDLHPLLDGSPAIDAANDSECSFIDQRGVERPQGPRCDIGAFEGGVGAPNLRVVVQIPDDSAAASEFTVHVFSQGQEVDSAPGSESGTPFNLPPGTYEIRRSGLDDYVRSFSGDCDGFGKVTIQADETRTCTLTLDAVTAPADDACLSYPSFAQTAGLNLLGDAAITGDVLRLNPGSGGMGGAWFGARRQIATGFTTDFKFRITVPPGNFPADGFAFVIQNSDIDALGEGGGGMGYQGIPNSLAVEFDTFSNGPEEDDSHVAVHTLGMQPNSAGAAARRGSATLRPFNDGLEHDVRVAYTPGTLNVFVDDMKTPKLTVDVDLWGELSLINASAYVGFTAATGLFTEAHDILSWSLCPPPKPTLNVVTEVADEGGWLPQDFTVGVSSDDLDVPGSPKPGDADGTSYSLDPGSYVVSEAAARGYAATIGGDCAADGTVTLDTGDTKTCTITNTPVPVADGLVVESYGPSRTSSDWGLAETFLTKTRGYLENPVNFGPSGIVARTLQVAPGIREANARTLAGVDVFFTGWVETGTYTQDEKAALRNFVLGGGTLIATTDDTDHTMVDAFGLSQDNGEGEPTTPNTISDQGHAIATGPFGAVTAYDQYFATGHYSQLGPDAHEIGRNDAGTTLAVIERHKLRLGSGAAIFVADVDVFSDQGGASVNEALIKNVFAFATESALSIGDVSAAEGASGGTTFTFTVALSGRSLDTVRVHYATADDTATAPSDYAAASGDLEFAPGQTAKTVSITVNGDDAVESEKRFRVNLSNASGARIADSQAVGTITNDDAAPDVQVQQQQQQQQPQQPQEEELPPPEAGETVNAEPKSGTVRVRLKGTNKFVELKEGEQVPVGSVLDTTKGRVTLVAASDKSGGTATADFYDGIFKVGQTKGSKPITTLELVEKLSCATGKASTAAKRKRKRRLWGDGSGRFRTDGEYSSATVRGTKWLVEDQCTSTLTKVARGKVAVKDFVKRKTVIVKAGQQYVARARR